MARTLLVAGTASHVGKSTVAAGLCRWLADRGVDVVPFKAQNMSNNARAVATPEGGFGEIGVSQYVQAQAARTPATTDVNPVLLKPRGDGESQLVLDGEAVAHLDTGTYYEEYWDDALATARAAHARLADDYEVVVAEGAGSIAEPNLLDRDLANVETARFADADVLLVADIERGGAFASLVGTLALMPADVRDRVVGAVLTKFRGDESMLADAIDAVEARKDVPVLGVVPHEDPGLPAEDSVSLPAVGQRAVTGADDGVPDERSVTVAVPRLPRVSNFTDMEPLAREPGVRVSYRPLDASLSDADAVVLPGTKNTVDDLLALREAGFGSELAAYEGPIVGICGGYQLLGERITNAGVEGTGDRETVAGFGLAPVETDFSPDKRVEPVSRTLHGRGPLAGAEGTVTGYEIHMGETEPAEPVERLFDDSGVVTDRLVGTYLHGLFENRCVRTAFVETMFADADRDRPAADDGGPTPADRAGALLAEHLADRFLRSLLGSGGNR
jgi:adenosylcobyric acid synthase